MKFLKIFIILAFGILALHFAILAKSALNKTLACANSSPKRNDYGSGKRGEKIIYDIKLGNVYLGQAIFKHLPDATIDGRSLYVMSFQTKLPQFMDTETIYSDPQTLLPIRIERDIVNWFVKENITENYNQSDYTLTINKKKGAKKQQLVIKKDEPIHNAILLPQYVRRVTNLKEGNIIIANLPKRRFQIKLISVEDLDVPAGTFKAYHFESIPKQIEIWISADERRIPLRIEGTGQFGYCLLLKEYSS